MSNKVLHIWENNRVVLRSTSSEVFTFQMVKIGGTPTDANDAITKAYAEAQFIPLSQKGIANGVATLDGTGKIPMSQLSASIMEYKGVYDASTHTPDISDASGGLGDTYRVSVSGSHDFGSGTIELAPGDLLVHNGTKFDKIDASESVSSVNGKTGAVVLNTDDVSEGSTNKYYVVSVARADLIASSIGSGDTLRAPTAASVYNALAGKSDVGHGHVIANVTGLQEALDGKSPVGHIHSIADVTDLQSNINNLQSQINNKANIDHTHTPQNLSEWEGIAVSAGALAKGKVVLCSWDGSSWTVQHASNASYAECDGLLGLVVRVSTGTAYIAVSETGVLTGFDSLAAGEMFVGVDGAAALSAPTAVGKCVRSVGRSLGNGAWVFRPGPAIEILS